MNTAATGEYRPSDVVGESQSLAAGAAGIALLHLETAARAGEQANARMWLSAMTENPVTAHVDECGLFRGAPAVAFVLHAANHHDGYSPALATLDSHIATMTQTRLDRAHQRIDREHPPVPGEWDLINGLTGLGVYLLYRHGGGELLRGVLTYLVRLTLPVTVDGDLVPGWWSREPPGNQSADHWPGGHGDLGLAHGVAGPLALLATAMRRGVVVADHADAIDRICCWLDAWRCGSGGDAWWPGMLTRAEHQSRTLHQPGPQRPSWCYGTPGIARAQQLAGFALADQRRQHQAENALAGCVSDGRQFAQVRDSSVCHGWAGLLLIVWRASVDAGVTSELAELVSPLTRHLHSHGAPARPGLLEGTAGVQLVQQTVNAGRAPVTRWDACLLLTG